jgi:hypothetical protein
VSNTWEPYSSCEVPESISCACTDEGRRKSYLPTTVITTFFIFPSK